jgi:hypothetical protein
MKQLVNCPNCGAPIHDYICSYCGTVFPTDLEAFNGRDTLLISIDDDKNLLLQNLSISSIESEKLYDSLCCDNQRYFTVNHEPRITIVGYPYDDKALMHHLKELKDIFNKRLRL